MLNFANEAFGSTQIFTQKNSLKKEILTEKWELENISRVLALLKEKKVTTNQVYQRLRQLSRENDKKKYELNQKIFQKKKELGKISTDLNQLNQIYNDYNLKYENIEELSIIDSQSEPIFRKELKNIEELLINEKKYSDKSNKLDLKEKLEIINQNLNEISHRRDEKKYLITLKDNASKKLKEKENELDSCKNQLTTLITQEKQIVLNKIFDRQI